MIMMMMTAMMMLTMSPGADQYSVEREHTVGERKSREVEVAKPKQTTF